MLPEWLSPLIAIFGGFGGAYMGVRLAINSLELRVTAIEKELGTRETGIRGVLHNLPKDFAKVYERIHEVENKIK